MSTVSEMTPANDVNLVGPMALADAKHTWLVDAEHHIAALVARSRRNDTTFTADDLRKLTDPPDHGSWVGVAFSQAKARGDIEAVGYVAAQTKTRNGGALRVWKVAGK